MVFFAMTRQGVEAFVSSVVTAERLSGISAGILTSEELSELHGRGFDVSDFDYEIHPGDLDVVADAISTIKEHHPDELLWVEG